MHAGLVLTYTVAGPEALASIVEHPEAIAHADGHRRTGVNTASLTLAALRAEGVRDRAIQAPHPRLHALLQAVGDAPYESDQAQDVRFRYRIRTARNSGCGSTRFRCHRALRPPGRAEPGLTELEQPVRHRAVRSPGVVPGFSVHVTPG
ncbi:hypothetical protein GCM10023323_67670 [Streptomyces thinghirensis]|uniref:DUF4158 domain-containing protein n=1 Tax=Streptomyces thinghirensis TaxID=551547 RepID=A0ABP9TCE6_9ACTN